MTPCNPRPRCEQSLRRWLSARRITSCSDEGQQRVTSCSVDVGLLIWSTIQFQRLVCSRYTIGEFSWTTKGVAFLFVSHPSPVFSLVLFINTVHVLITYLHLREKHLYEDTASPKFLELRDTCLDIVLLACMHRVLHPRRSTLFIIFAVCHYFIDIIVKKPKKSSLKKFC